MTDAADRHRPDADAAPPQKAARGDEGVRDWLRPFVQADSGRHAPMGGDAFLPIRPIGPHERWRIEKHLLALSAGDRYLRFGYTASDAQIGRYVADLDFGHDEIFGICNRWLRLVGMAHLAYPKDAQFESCAEFGVSVAAHARGRGYGTRLYRHAAMHARNRGIKLLFIQALSENTPMLKIARNAGARVERDGPESEAYLKLPEATQGSRLSEAVHTQLSQIDFALKTQAKAFGRWLKHLRYPHLQLQQAQQAARRHERAAHERQAHDPAAHDPAAHDPAAHDAAAHGGGSHHDAAAHGQPDHGPHHGRAHDA